MAQIRRRRRSTWSDDVEAEIVELGLRDNSAAVVREQLCKRYALREIPSVRAIEYRLAKLRTPDEGPYWTVATATGDEAELVLPVLGAIIEQTESRTVRLSRELSEWIIRIRRAAPDLPPFNVYGFARLYLSAAGHGDSTEALDKLLALGAWRDPQRWSATRIVELVPEARELPAGLLTSAGLWRALQEHKARRAPGSRRKAGKK